MINITNLKTLHVSVGTIRLGEKVMAGNYQIEVIGYIQGVYVGWEKPGAPLFILKILE
jgi:hypothetical protein